MTYIEVYPIAPTVFSGLPLWTPDKKMQAEILLIPCLVPKFPPFFLDTYISPLLSY